MPYPLDEYLDALDADYARIARRLLRAANWKRGPSPCGRFELDAGEALMDERSETLWGGLRLDRDVSSEGRRALVRRVLERLERDGWASRRAAHAGGPGISPRSGPRNGPTPTVVRFLKYREILWSASIETAQGTAQDLAQETAQGFGPILPASPPEPPPPPDTEKRPSRAPAARRRRAGEGEEPDPRHRLLQERLEAVFEEKCGHLYGFGGRDAKAITDLLRFSGGDLDDVVSRWRAALTETSNFHRCRSIHELATKWNHFADARPVGWSQEYLAGVERGR
jgi:hypothetical protein